MSYRLSNN